MPYYSDDVIEEVRQRNDIVDVISQYVHLQKKGTSYFGLCPFHSEKTGSFSVTPSKQMFYCFGCGAGGNVFNFLQRYDNLTFPEAVQQLADRVGYQLPVQQMSGEELRKNAHKATLLEIQKEAAGYYYRLLRSKDGEHALKYFTDRGLSAETMQSFGLGYAGKGSDQLYQYLKEKRYSDQDLRESGLVTFQEKRGLQDKFWNRVMFPIMDVNRRVVAFGGRVMGDGEPKYLNSPESEIFNKSKLLFGMHVAKRTKADAFILCEGYMDVISLHQAGFDNAVASLGTALTSGHANLIRKMRKTLVYLSYDSDGAGTAAALRAIPILDKEGITCKIINMQPYKDPDEFIKNLGREEYQKRIDEAENSFLFRMRMEQRKYDMADPESNSKFFDEVANAIALEFHDELTRDNYTKAVADTFHVGFVQLKEKVNHAGTSMQNEGGLISGKQDLYREENVRDDYLPQAPKSGRKKRSKDEGMMQSQRLLLTWMVERPAIYEKIKDYIEPQDFTEGIYADVATELFAQFESGNISNPARILDHYEDEEDQRQVAEIFNTTVGEIEDPQDFEKALKETLVRIKQFSLQQQQKKLDPSDPNTVLWVINAKQQITKLEKIKITL